MMNAIEELPHYVLQYTNAKGKQKEYEISRPFDTLKDKDGNNIGFTAYAYGKGIRSFKHDRIQKMEAVKIRA